MQERSSLDPARGKYTPGTAVLKATPASYLSMARERIETITRSPSDKRTD
jgi:hypothetical protein